MLPPVQVGCSTDAEDGHDESSSTTGSGNPLPWLVLYCGANPRVEEAFLSNAKGRDVGLVGMFPLHGLAL